MRKLVSVITPTWLRYDMLFDRCIPSVQDQHYPSIEHIVVSDGPDPSLSRRIEAWGAELAAQAPPVNVLNPDMRVITRAPLRHRICFTELPAHEPRPHWGHLARNHGLSVAAGEYIAYLDDDDSFRPEHVELLANALDENPDAGFVYSRMASHTLSPNPGIIGGPTLLPGTIGTPMIMHRKEITEHGVWGPAHATEDWHLVDRWMRAGVKPVHLPVITVDVWPSVYR